MVCAVFVFWGRNPSPKLGECRNDHCFSLLKRQSVSQWWCYFITLDLFWVREIRHASWQLLPPPHGAENQVTDWNFQQFFLSLFFFTEILLPGFRQRHRRWYGHDYRSGTFGGRHLVGADDVHFGWGGGGDSHLDPGWATVCGGNKRGDHVQQHHSGVDRRRAAERKLQER